ncbi:MAG: hypothetical protein ACFB4J_09825 [Elainellaceae cyanobacterium]
MTDSEVPQGNQPFQSEVDDSICEERQPVAVSNDGILTVDPALLVTVNTPQNPEQTVVDPCNNSTESDPLPDSDTNLPLSDRPSTR